MAPQTQTQTLSQLPISPAPFTPRYLQFTPKTPSLSDRVTSESDDTISVNSQSYSVIFPALCMFDFTSSETGILSFKKNEILDIIKCADGGWWAAMRTGESILGWIPHTFVSPLTQDTAERLRDIREELRGSEYKRLQGLFYSYENAASRSVAGNGSALSPLPESKSLVNIYHNRSGEPLDIRKLVDSPQSRISPTTSTHHRPLGSASAQINSSLPQPKGTDDSRLRACSLSTRNHRRNLVTADDDVTLSRISTLIRSTDRCNQIDKLATSFRTITEVNKPSQEGELQSKFTEAGGNSFRAISSTINKEIRKDKVQGKFTEAGGISFGALLSTINKEMQKDKVQGQVIEHGGPVINIGRPPPVSTPWYLHPQYADQLDADDKGNVRSGSLLALFEVLTTDPGTSNTMKLAQFKTFTNIFLMTFRTFTTADHFFNMLVERFHLKPKESLTEYEFLDWKTHLRIPVQRLVLDIFSIWLENHRLLEEEPHIAQRLKDFLTLIVSPPYNKTAIIIIQTIDRLTSTKLIRMASSTMPKKTRKLKINKLDLLKLDPKILAEQLSVYEFGLYVKITPQQCLAYVKTRTGDDDAKLRDFCSTHDKLDAWVKMSILNSDATGKRANTVDFWIKVAEKCRALNNISSMSAIITALSSTVITGLQLTWAHTSRKSVLDGLLQYSEPTGGFAGYRTLLQQAEGPCVPFITMFLTEMAHVQDQFSGSEGRISFYQLTRRYETITAMLLFQSRPYNIAADEPIINFIEGNLQEGSCCDPGWLWKRSQETQKAEVTHADIRKGLEAAGF